MRTLFVAALLLFAFQATQPAAVTLPVELPVLGPHVDQDVEDRPSEGIGELIGTLALPSAFDGRLPGRSAPDAPLRALPVVAATATASAFIVLAGLALYSRLARSELLDHERRDAILKLVKATPGIPLTNIASALGSGWGTAVYHLERLERAGFIASQKDAGRRCYFAVGDVARDARAGSGTLMQETTRDVAAFVTARPGATQSDLCEGLGLSASAASKQVTKLESAGLVRRERSAKSVLLHPEPRLAALMAAS